LLEPVDVVWVERKIHELAVSAFLVAPGVSIVDRVSFEVMRGFGINTAFAFDRDFADEGFATVP
jgi:predicted nucleic acid-binding protein